MKPITRAALAGAGTFAGATALNSYVDWRSTREASNHNWGAAFMVLLPLAGEAAAGAATLAGAGLAAVASTRARPAATVAAGVGAALVAAPAAYYLNPFNPLL